MARLCAGSLDPGMGCAYRVVALKYDHDPDAREPFIECFLADFMRGRKLVRFCKRCDRMVVAFHEHHGPCERPAIPTVEGPDQ